MTLEGTDAIVAAAGIEGYSFLDEARTANRLVPELKKQGVESIVVLLHEGATQDPAPGDINACNVLSGPVIEINSKLDPEIDAVITGHTHQPYNCMLPGPDGRKRMVTSAYSFGRVISEINLVLDKDTGEVRRALSRATNHAVIQSALTPDPALTAVINKWTPLFEAAGNTPVGTITADILRGGTPPGADRGVESAAVNLVADAQAWATSFNGAQISFMNAGGVRSDLTYAPSGAEGRRRRHLRRGVHLPAVRQHAGHDADDAAHRSLSVLQQQCQPAGSSRPFLSLGSSAGFTYTLSRTIVNGTCTAVSITDVKLNGKALDPAATYWVTVSTFLADGGDNFTTFKQVPVSERLDGGNDLQALTDYLGTFSPVAPPSTSRVNEVP